MPFLVQGPRDESQLNADYFINPLPTYMFVLVYGAQGGVVWFFILFYFIFCWFFVCFLHKAFCYICSFFPLENWLPLIIKVSWYTLEFTLQSTHSASNSLFICFLERRLNPRNWKSYKREEDL